MKIRAVLLRDGKIAAAIPEFSVRRETAGRKLLQRALRELKKL
jgi:hypothetical protein